MPVINKYHGNIPTDAINIMRGSIYGNPFIIGKDGTREEVVEKYEVRLRDSIKNPTFSNYVKSLYGKTLVCCCKPKLCHGDILESVAKELNESL